jgi:TRAP-type C4-dicarboxylate transport system substrate-binding protein
MKQRRYVKALIVLGTLVFMIGFLNGPSVMAVNKKVIKLKFGAGHPTAAPWVSFASNFFCKEAPKRIDERTNYKLEISELWGGSVAKLGEVLEAVEIGILDMGIVIIGFDPTKCYLHNWQFNIPFYMHDPRKSIRVRMKVYEEFPIFEDVFKKYNQIHLGAGGHDDYGLISTFPVRKAEDLKGHKICAAGSNIPWIKGTGAVPVQGTLNEAYTGLQTGVYDGWVMFPSSTVSFKLHEVAKNYTLTNFGSVTGVQHITINTKVWNKLPPEVQKILREVGKEYTIKQHEAVNDLSEKALKTMRDSGVAIHQLPHEEKVKWASMLINQPKQWAEEAEAKGYPGTAIMKATIKYAEQEGHVFLRNWMEE